MTYDDTEFEIERSSQTPLLDRIAEAGLIPQRPFVESGEIKQTKELSKAAFIIEFPGLLEWLSYAKTDTSVAIDVVNDLPASINDKTSPIVRDFINMFSHPDDREPEGSSSVYDSTMVELCAEVAIDIKKNNGQKFKSIMERTSVAIMVFIAENEDFRSKLEDLEDPNVYDVDRILTEASIFYMASVLHKETLALLKRAGDVGGTTGPKPDDLIS